MFSRMQSRGTGPRATGQVRILLSMRCSGSGDPELQFPLGPNGLEETCDPPCTYNLANRDNPENPAPLLLILKIV